MKRSTLIAVVVFAALLAVVLLMRSRPVQRGTERLSFAGLEAAQVDRLLVSGGGSSVELERQDGVWRLASGRLADPDRVERAIEGLQGVDTSEVVSTAEARHQEFGVDAEGGTTVEAMAGEARLARIVVGGSATGGGGYIRAVGEDTVFQTAPALGHLFPADAKSWLQLRLVDLELDQAQRIEIALAGQDPYAIVASPSGNEWQVEDPAQLPPDFRFDGAGARSLAGQLVGLRASELVDDATDRGVAGLAGDHDRFTVVADGSSLSVHVGAANEDGDNYAEVDGRDAIFLIPSYRAKNLRKGITDLRDLRLMHVDAAAATGLRIVDAGSEYRIARGEDGAWRIDPDAAQPPADFSYDPTSVERLLQVLPNIRATAIAEGISASRAGLTRPRTLVEVTSGDETARLEFGKSAPAEDSRELVYAHGNADDHIYTVAAGQRDRFTRGWELFAPPPEMPAAGNPFANLDPETLKNLPPEVRESLMQQMLEEQRKQQLLQQLRKQGSTQQK